MKNTEQKAIEALKTTPVFRFNTDQQQILENMLGQGKINEALELSCKWEFEGRKLNNGGQNGK